MGRKLSRHVAWLLLFAAAATLAHRAPGSVSTIEFNPRSGMTEIVHRLHLHDAELGVASVLEDPSLSLSNLKSRARVALYASERFELKAGDEPLTLDIVGAEISGDYLVVYQEREGRLSGRIDIRDDILRDAFPRQVNQVNIDSRGTVRTLSFSGEDRWKSFDFGDDRRN